MANACAGLLHARTGELEPSAEPAHSELIAREDADIVEETHTVSRPARSQVLARKTFSLLCSAIRVDSTGYRWIPLRRVPRKVIITLCV